MVNIKGIKAYLINPEFVSEVPIETEDLYAQDETKLRSVKQDSFRKVHQPECDFEQSVARDKSNMDEILQKGKSNLVDFIRREIFTKSDKEVGYLYRQVYEEREQCGLLFAVNDRDYVNGKILPHEQTFEDKVERLSEGADALGIYNSFPLAFCDSNSLIDGAIEEVKNTKPMYLLNQNGVEHHFYAFDDKTSDKLVEEFKRFSEIYIADGHHRFECYSKLVQKLRKDKNRALYEDYDYYPVLIYPKNHLKAYSYYRLVKNLNSIDVDKVLNESKKYFKIQSIDIPHKYQSEPYNKELSKLVKPYKKGRFLVYFTSAKRWYKFKALPYKPNNPIEGLDISYISTNFLTHTLHINDLKSADSLEYIPENKLDIVALEQQCDSDESTSIVVVCPRTSLDEVQSVADARTCMPPKSTFVYPKPLIGLLFKDFEPLK